MKPYNHGVIIPRHLENSIVAPIGHYGCGQGGEQSQGKEEKKGREVQNKMFNMPERQNMDVRRKNKNRCKGYRSGEG